MKSYSFYFNASDWLASPTVKQMSLAERGAYIGLLAFAWNSEQPGTLPASADKVRRIAEMSAAEWAESGETILEKFPLSDCGTYRYNPRLLAEAAKEQARSEKAKASAEMRWQSKRNADAMRTQSERNANAPETPCERNAIVKYKERKEKEGGKEPPARSPQAESKPIYWPEEAPVFQRLAFFAFARKIGFAHADLAIYWPQIIRKAESVNEQRDNTGWEDFTVRYFNNEVKYDRLMVPTATDAKPDPAPIPDNPTDLWGWNTAEPATTYQPAHEPA